jgi:methionine-rich copper-binding protein CopC
MKVLKTLALGAVLLAGSVPAFAHAHLEHASPAVDSVMTGAPPEVRIWFTQALEASFSGAELRSADGAVVAKGEVDPDERRCTGCRPANTRCSGRRSRSTRTAPMAVSASRSGDGAPWMS